MLGLYENFPLNIHKTETFNSTLSKRSIQQKIVQALQQINNKTFSFEEVGTPTVPNATVIFEFGIADTGGFTFLNNQEAKQLTTTLDEAPLQVMDWFCAIRYYKNSDKQKQPLKFDYYLIRSSFGEKGVIEFAVSHERGPRYITPEDLLIFITSRVNASSKRKIITEEKVRHEKWKE
jgi:hypothetical protein